MRPTTVPAALVLLTLVSPAFAEDRREQRSASVEVGYRSVDVNGSLDKYREDVNLPEGLRLLDLSFTDTAPNAVYDTLTLSAYGIGGDPFTGARFRMRDAGTYDLDLSYRSSDYFYNDQGYWFRPIGDLHKWDTRRSFFNGVLTLNITDKIDLRFGANLMDRGGRSTTSRDVQRNEFVLFRPVDQEAATYWIGADFRVGWADITVEQRFLSNEQSWNLGTSNNPGLEPGAFLDDYRQTKLEDADTPVTRLLFRGRPVDRFDFRLGYTLASAELDYTTDGEWSGLDFTGAAFQTTLNNQGRVERDLQRLDLDFTIRLIERLELLLDYASRAYDQDGTIDSLETQTGGAEAGTYPIRGTVTNELELDTYGLTLNWQATPKLSLAVGAGWQQRDSTFELSGPTVETERTLYRGILRWRPADWCDLLFDYEDGDDDSPLTQVSPTAHDRVRVAARFKPVGGLGLNLVYQDRSTSNELSYPLGAPTDDVPPAADVSLAEFGVTSWSADLTWTRKGLNLALGYTDTELDFDSDIVYVTGFTFFPQFDVFTTRQTTGYLEDQTLVRGMLRYRWTRHWELEARGWQSDSTGSMPVESIYYGAWVKYEGTAGWFLRLRYEVYDYQENNPFAGLPAVPTPGINNYDADLWTMSVGFRY